MATGKKTKTATQQIADREAAILEKEAAAFLAIESKVAQFARVPVSVVNSAGLINGDAPAAIIEKLEAAGHVFE